VIEVLLDTHTWAWSLTADPQLSSGARAAIQAAEAVYVSPISFFEIAQKVRLGKWPEMAPHVRRLAEILRDQGGKVAPISPAIALDAGLMSWAHRDPFDRFLAATALQRSFALVSADAVFDDVGVRRVW
jgi:PIN domain nuclease of toxin-antitoxin system